MANTRRSIVADRVNAPAPHYIFPMFEAFCEDIKSDKQNFDE